MSGERNIRVGLLGPGRRRNGLGPFLADWVERAGARVIAAAGRDLARTRADCDDLAERLGHPVEARRDASELTGEGDLDALIVASPPAAHLDGLLVAAERRLATLCEKPIVPVGSTPELWPVLDRFGENETLLMENCQWPEALSGFAALHPGWSGAPPRRVAMRLSPSQPGRPGLEDSLSHYLSLLQAVLPVDANTVVVDVEVRRRDDEFVALELAFERPFGRVPGYLELGVCRSQPRPAWIQLDELRAHREIRPEDYAIALRDGDRSVAIPDPLGSLVSRFVGAIGTPGAALAAAELDRVRQRARLYASILDAFDRA